MITTQLWFPSNELTGITMEDTPLFPDPPAITVERTLALIKPDAIHRAEEVMEDIKRNGFTILQVSGSRLVWSPEKLRKRGVRGGKKNCRRISVSSAVVGVDEGKRLISSRC